MAWWYGRGPGFGPQSFGAYIISQATGFLRCAAAYLRFQPALIFPLAASRQLRRALTIRYRDSSVDSNIPGTSLDQGVSSHFKILSAEIEIEHQRSLNHYSLLHRNPPLDPCSREGLQDLQPASSGNIGI